LQFNSIDITTTCLESNARKWLEEEEEEEEEEIGDWDFVGVGLKTWTPAHQSKIQTSSSHNNSANCLLIFLYVLFDKGRIKTKQIACNIIKSIVVTYVLNPLKQSSNTKVRDSKRKTEMKSQDKETCKLIYLNEINN